MKKLKITGAVILLLAGLVMIFNEQIKCVIVDWMTNSSLKQPVKMMIQKETLISKR